MRSKFIEIKNQFGGEGHVERKEALLLQFLASKTSLQPLDSKCGAENRNFAWDRDLVSAASVHGP